MFELILNAAKLATSEDARKSASALIEIIRKSPEWQQDICTLEAKVPKEYEEQALLLSDLTASKLANLEYSQSATDAFISIYFELVRNVFEYGCKKEKDKATIIIEITKTYVSLSVYNPKWRKVDVKNLLGENSDLPNNDSISVRGRGLMLCNELADSLKSISNRTGVKAVIFKDRVDLSLDVYPGLLVIKVKNGDNNPSLIWRLNSLISKYPDERIILHFHRNYGYRRTDVSSLILRANFHTENPNAIRAVLLFTGDTDNKFHIPKEMICRTWKEALHKLGKSDMYFAIFPPPKPGQLENSKSVTQARLEVLEGPTDMIGRIFELNNETYILGKSIQADIRFYETSSSTSISNTHIKLEKDKYNNWFMSNISDDKTGTFIDESPFREFESEFALRNGQTIRMGHFGQMPVILLFTLIEVVPVEKNNRSPDDDIFAEFR